MRRWSHDAAGYNLAIGYDANSNDRQLQSLSYAPPQAQTPSEALVFTHSPEHLLQTLAINPQKPSPQQPFNYTYDADYRLLAQHQRQMDNIAQGTAAPQITQNIPFAQYVYDAADNLTQSTLAQPNSTTSATANNLNQLAKVNNPAWQYDADGNLLNDGTFRYGWDAAHRLISVTGISTGNITSFQYDGLGRRLIIAQQNGGIGLTGTHYLWCGHTICGARTGKNVVSADYYPQGELHGSQALYYVKDQIGSVLGVMNASGTLQGTDLYTPYGGTKTSAGTQSDMRYAGMLYNAATGLYLTPYRAYNSTVGRWLSRDPIGEEGGENIYAYVGNNPLMYYDPYGLWAWGDTLPQGLVDGVTGFGDGVYRGITFGLGDLQDVRNLAGIEGGVDRCSKTYQIAHVAGEVEGAAALGGSLASKSFVPGGWTNSNRYLRIGYGRNGGNRVFRAAGQWVEGLTGSAHVDFWTAGKW